MSEENKKQQEPQFELNENQQIIIPDEPRFEANPVFEEAQAPIQEKPEKLKHSGLGIASFILALASGLTFIIGMIMSVMSVMGDNGIISSTMDPNNVEAIESAMMNSDAMVGIMVAGFIIMFAGLLSFIGLVLGIIGLIIKNRKKVFAIIGTIMNAIPVILTIVFTIIGLMMQSAVM